MPLDDAILRSREWYEVRNLPPMIAVPFPMSGPEASATDRRLAEQGWPLRDGPAVVMTASPRQLAQQQTRPAEITQAPGDEWLAMYHYRGQELPPVARQLLTSAPWQAFAGIREDGQVIAIGRVAGSGEWAGLTAIETHPAHRRRGLATAITVALAAQAAAAGYPGLFLQVESGNAAAQALYAGMGFTSHHRYHYRLAPPA